MQRRNFLIGAASTAIGGSALVGSGAFSLARAERDITVGTADDSDAYLGLEAESAYAEDSGGQLELDFDGGFGDQNGDGLNDNADTRFDDVFKIVNNGTNDIDRISFHDQEGETGYDSPAATWYYSDDPTGGSWDVGGEVNSDNPGIEIAESLYIHVIFNLTDYDTGDLPDHLGIVAEAEDDD